MSGGARRVYSQHIPLTRPQQKKKRHNLRPLQSKEKSVKETTR